MQTSLDTFTIQCLCLSGVFFLAAAILCFEGFYEIGKDKGWW